MSTNSSVKPNVNSTVNSTVNFPVTFNDWVTWLETRHMMPLIAPGLDRTKTALSSLGFLSECSYAKNTIHIAGTNGKGTTARALEHLLLSAGETVGLFTSPHLISTCERLRTNGEMITENAFSDLCLKHKNTIVENHLTHFEALTVMAFDYFLNIKKTKWMIFEIGLGGTWDSTNAIPHSTSVLTSIGFDHMHILGNTLEEIAQNKFGIVQNNNLVVHTKYPNSLDTLLKEKINATQSKNISSLTLPFVIKKELVPKYSLVFKNKTIDLLLPGKRTVENLSLAITTFLELGFSEYSVENLNTLYWPARMTKLEVPTSPCPVYLSGDHNLQGLESLLELLKNSTYNKIKIILGLSKNRSHESFVERLKELPNSEIFFTQPHFMGVSPDPDTFRPFFKEPLLALQAATKTVDAKDLIVITGSLYLCGDYLKLFPS